MLPKTCFVLPDKGRQGDKQIATVQLSFVGERSRGIICREGLCWCIFIEFVCVGPALVGLGLFVVLRSISALPPRESSLVPLVSFTLSVSFALVFENKILNFKTRICWISLGRLIVASVNLATS